MHYPGFHVAQNLTKKQQLPFYLQNSSRLHSHRCDVQPLAGAVCDDTAVEPLSWKSVRLNANLSLQKPATSTLPRHFPVFPLCLLPFLVFVPHTIAVPVVILSRAAQSALAHIHIFSRTHNSPSVQALLSSLRRFTLLYLDRAHVALHSVPIRLSLLLLVSGQDCIPRALLDD